MNCILLELGLLTISIFLFFRQDKIDRRERLRRDMESDLHMILEMRKAISRNGEVTEKIDAAILDMQQKLKQFK